MPSINSPTPDATTTSKGKIQLAGDLSGTASAPSVQSQTIQRQDNTTNTTPTTNKIQAGWGFITNVTSTDSVTKTVTFPVAYAAAPIVTVTQGGDSVAGTTYGSGANNVEGRLLIKAFSITNTGFVVQIRTGGATNLGAGNSFFQWIAIGA